LLRALTLQKNGIIIVYHQQKKVFLMVIDAHCHIYPDKIADKAAHSTGRFYSLPTTYDGKVSTLLENGAKAGIDKFVVQSVATTPKQVSSINKFIAAEVAAHPDKLYGLGTLHPDSENIRADVEELISLGLGGVKLHPDIQQFKLDDYRCLKIYELCEEFKLPVLLHTGDSRYDYSNPNRLIPILDIYDKMVVVGAHFGGWSMWDEASKLLADRENFYVDCSSSFYALSDDKIREIIARYGVDRVLFGTDYPMWSVETDLKRFYTLGYNQEDSDKILYKNAVKVYGLKL